MREAEYTHHKLATIHSIGHYALQIHKGHVLLLAHAQFHFHNGVEVTIAIADSGITSRYFNYQYYRSALEFLHPWLDELTQS